MEKVSKTIISVNIRKLDFRNSQILFLISEYSFTVVLLKAT